MSLINYIEPINLGSIFLGIGGLFIFLTISYLMLRIFGKFADYLDISFNRDIKYELLEETQLEKIAEKMGIDLNNELIKRKLLATVKPTSFRKKVEQKIFENLFPEERNNLGVIKHGEISQRK